MSEDSLSELQREWRQRITGDIDALKRMVEGIATKLNEQREDYVRRREHDELEARLKAIESDRQKVMGGVTVVVIGLQIVGAVVMWALGKFLK